MVILALIEERVRFLCSTASATEVATIYDDIQICGQWLPCVVRNKQENPFDTRLTEQSSRSRTGGI